MEHVRRNASNDKPTSLELLGLRFWHTRTCRSATIHCPLLCPNCHVNSPDN